MNTKRKYCQYSEKYLQFGFIPSPSYVQLLMCLLCGEPFSNEAMKPSQLSDHLEKKQADKKDEPVAFFQDSTDKFRKREREFAYLANAYAHTQKKIQLLQ